MIEKDKRVKLPTYLKEWVAQQECFVCGSPDVQCSHLMGYRAASLGKGLATKSHDFLAAPLCPEHHAAYEARDGYFKCSDTPIGAAEYSDLGLFMGVRTLARALQSGDWELRRRK